MIRVNYVSIVFFKKIQGRRSRDTGDVSYLKDIIEMNHYRNDFRYRVIVSGLI
jgi:hypothetical protein